MVQQLDLDSNRTISRDGDHPPATPACVPPALAITNPVHPTTMTFDEHYRFTGKADAPIGTKRVTIALRGATSFHLTFPHRAQPDAAVTWDVTLVIQLGISEVTVTTEDHAGIRTPVRRLLIARTFAAPALRPAM